MDLSEIALTAGRKQKSSGNATPVDIITFVTSKWGLNQTLYPVQRIILKASYGMALDDVDKCVTVWDWRHENTSMMTEAEYLRHLYDNQRCNVREILPGVQRRELVLAIGRRSGKCILGDSLVLTGDGIYRLEELGDPDGPEVQPVELMVAQEGHKQSRSKFFYNGGVRDTRTLTTRCGYQLGGTDNHRIKVLTKQGEVDWCYLADLQVGDVVCIPQH